MSGAGFITSDRFMVTFVTGLLPNPLDIAFQSVSGLGRQIAYSSLRQGGENIAEHHFAERASRNPLQMTRGVMPTSPLTMQLNLAMSSLVIPDLHLIVMVLGATARPSSVWTFEHVLPTRWDVGGLDASASSLLINTFEFVYRDVVVLGSHS